MKKNVILLAWLIPISVGATELAWVKLTPLFTYRDLTVNCSTEHYPVARYLSLKIEQGQAIGAVLHRDLGMLSVNPLSLGADEVGGLRIAKNENGDWRVTRWHLSGRLLDWFFRNSGSALSCVPPQRLSTVSPATFVYEFPLSATWEHSNRGTFIGRRKDGGVYRAELEFLHETNGTSSSL